MKYKNAMQEPVRANDDVFVFVIDAHADEWLKELGETSGLIATRYADSSVLLVGSKELFERFWTAWTLAT